MKHIKFTYVDAVTGISVASEPAANGPVMPAVKGLRFEWARESAYPTDVPEFFGTCDEDASTQVDGVLAVLTQEQYDHARASEMRARIPQSITMRQARLALLAEGLLDDVDAAIAAIADPLQKRAAQIEWEFSNEVQRGNAVFAQVAAAMGITDEQIDALFVKAARL